MLYILYNDVYISMYFYTKNKQYFATRYFTFDNFRYLCFRQINPF